MKGFLQVSLIVGALAFTGCNSGPDGASQNTTTTTVQQTFRYQYDVNGCDTHPRLAISTGQLCQNLQFDGANNSCAEDARKAKFNDACPGQTWNPQAASDAINGKPGAHVNCFVSDGYASIEQLESGERYVNEQYTADPLTVIPHDDFVAVVTQSLAAGKFTLHIKLMTDYPDGTVIGEGEKSWQDQEPDSLEVDATSSQRHATCWPSIH
jgi:hypothetical protein